MKRYETRREHMLEGFYNEYKPRVVCEVGVQRGLFSKLILKCIPSIEKLIKDYKL
jgi:hypothetical protein